MSYESNRYKAGLSGEKPGWVAIDKEGHRAQTAGYEDHLRNKDLAERMNQRESDGDWPSNESSSSGSEPLSSGEKIFWGIVATVVGGWILLGVFYLLFKSGAFF